MIKRERGVLTYMSQEVNGMKRDNYVAGRHLAETVDEKLEMALAKGKEVEEDLER